MKKYIADEWVKALRSGKYKQGRDRLVNETFEYCCLGVLCEVVGDTPSTTRGELDIVQMEKATLRTSIGYLGDGQVNLANLNDQGVRMDGITGSVPLTFDEIADVIQMCWEEL